jgi:hypothetical protein
MSGCAWLIIIDPEVDGGAMLAHPMHKTVVMDDVILANAILWMFVKLLFAHFSCW